jgi:hypothetical protein
MRKNTLLITVATAALIAGASMAPAQAPSGQMGQGAQGQQQAPTTGQAPQRQEGQQPMQRQEGQTQQRQQERAQPQQQQPPAAQQQQREPQRAQPQQQPGAQQQQAQPGAPAQLTTEQRTRISSIVKTKSEARVSNVNFSISVGTVVPRTVKLVALPEEVVVIHPAWRGYLFFIVGDQIVIVEPGSLRIVAVLPA